MRPSEPKPGIRRAAPPDLAALVRLCAAHAGFERAGHDPAGHGERLEVALFSAEPRALAWVAEVGDEIIGFAAGAVEFSTWSARQFLHLDCLYIEDSHRGAGIGAALLDAVCGEARARQLETVQWWTPAWNEQAIAFYRRHGARASERTRFELALSER
ncbi:MAG TPA: GNAT family N-acetyltransferase [Aliidongia sp.]|uniref:GNAT family N-acetyltransferase n=1 Tax=Aliidongia sp. TaxID=1914230 RepID=UPI002DDD99CA|nr:GNAT family N-acetyltransferase [Aliidongia sp.]HEV2676406.1 GNAT family N-acetyltransferase [Aliidongia sp.]